jgi:hypothetical protein
VNGYQGECGCVICEQPRYRDKKLKLRTTRSITEIYQQLRRNNNNKRKKTHIKEIKKETILGRKLKYWHMNR